MAAGGAPRRRRAARVLPATPLGPTEGSVDAVRADDRVEVTHRDGVYALEPADGEATTALVFYPGGHVTADAYLESLAPLAARANVAVYVPEMPLQFAVLDPAAADQVIDAHPDVDRWLVGGHSLGGAMACRYASGHPERVDGLVLLAAYCEADRSPTVPTLSVTGSADIVLDRDTYRSRLAVLPPDATVVELDGVNHSQFGAYTGQRGDAPSSIDYATAHDRLADVVVPWVAALADGNTTADTTASAFAHADVVPTSHAPVRQRAATPPRTGRAAPR